VEITKKGQKNNIAGGAERDNQISRKHTYPYLTLKVSGDKQNKHKKTKKKNKKKKTTKKKNQTTNTRNQNSAARG